MAAHFRLIPVRSGWIAAYARTWSQRIAPLAVRHYRELR
jgi:hypothetical protein